VKVSAANPAPVTLELKAKPEEEKPIRKILEKQIQVGEPYDRARGSRGSGKEPPSSDVPSSPGREPRPWGLGLLGVERSPRDSTEC
jgi:hypothetical protein